MGRMRVEVVKQVTRIKSWENRFNKGTITEERYKKFLSKVFGG